MTNTDHSPSSSNLPTGVRLATDVVEDLRDARLCLTSQNRDDQAWAIADAERVLRALSPSGLRDEALAAIEIARRGELRPLHESLMLVCFPFLKSTRRHYPPAAFAHLPPVPTPLPKKPHRQHWTDDLADLDREDLECLGMRRVSNSDFFAEDSAERQAELMRALGAANGFKPKADPSPAKPRRQRKPSTARLIAKAKELGVDVTVEPDGTATFRTGSAATDTSDPEIELKKWIAKHAR